MIVNIRQASLDDLDLLLKWRLIVLRDVFSLAEDEPLDELWQQNRQYYQSALPTGNHIACFAYTNDTIVGCGGLCLYQEMPSPDNLSGYCAYLMNIYTHPSFRKQGIGKKIVSWLLQQAQQRAITKIYLETSDSGRLLYQQMAFTDMSGYMYYSKPSYFPL